MWRETRCRPRLFLRANGASGNSQERACLSRGSFWSGRAFFSRAGSQRSRRYRKRFQFWSRRQRLDERCGRTGILFARTSKRNGVRERNGRVRSARAIRRDQTIRLRPRAWWRRDSRVYKRQDGLDRIACNACHPELKRGTSPKLRWSPKLPCELHAYVGSPVVSATRDDAAMLIKTTSAARAHA